MYRHLIHGVTQKLLFRHMKKYQKYLQGKKFKQVRKNDPLFNENCVVKDHWSDEKQFDYVDEDIFTAPNGSEIK